MELRIAREINQRVDFCPREHWRLCGTDRTPAGDFRAALARLVLTPVLTQDDDLLSLDCDFDSSPFHLRFPLACERAVASAGKLR